MQTFKRTPINFIKNAFYTLLAPIGIVIIIPIILSIFASDLLENIYVLIAIGVLALLSFIFLVHSVLFTENIKVEVTDTEFRYYTRGSHLKYTFKLNECSFGYQTSSDGMSTDKINLNVKNHVTGTAEIINCEPLGPTQFHKLFALLENNEQTADTIVDLAVEGGK